MTKISKTKTKWEGYYRTENTPRIPSFSTAVEQMVTKQSHTISSPFYLLAYNNSECQQVNGAPATKEFIRFDNEDRGNKDAKGGTYPHAYGNLIISYCYYEG